jgi:Fe-S-cluster containining protein
MFSSLTFAGLIRYLKHALLGKDIIITGSCRQCGSCCRKLSLDIKGSWLTSVSLFNELVQDSPDYKRFRIIGKDKHGFLEFACAWLQEDGKCLDYENRLRICKDFPDKKMFLMNGVVPAECAYVMQQGTPFEKILKKKMKKGRSAYLFR